MSKVNLGFFNGIPNFGDLLNIDIPNDLFGTEIVPTPYSKCEAVFIGSLLECLTSKKRVRKAICAYFKPKVHIWGTGFICAPEDEEEYIYRHIIVHAVRGYISLERLQRIKGKNFNGVAIGDPGLLASRLIDASRISKEYQLGIIPHYVDQEDPLLGKIKVKNSVILDITKKPKDLLLQMAKCENIISSAMHGLIAADSLNIPNIRMIMSDKITGGDYKFNDYYSAFGIECHNRINLNEREFTDKDMQELQRNYQVTKPQVDKICEELLKSFPYE